MSNRAGCFLIMLLVVIIVLISMADREIQRRDATIQQLRDSIHIMHLEYEEGCVIDN